MKIVIIIGLFVLFLVSVQFASAQTVDEVIDKYIVARGGLEKLTAIKTISMEGSREMMGNEISIKITKEQGKLSRTEFEMGSTNGFMLITETTGWSFFPMRMDAPQKMEDTLIAAMQTETDIAGPLVNYAAKGHKTVLAGKENVGDITCFKILLTTNAGKSITYWIQADNYLLIQSTQAGAMMGGRRRGNAEQGNDPQTDKTYIVYSDYKAVDGVLFAHSIETKREGNEARPGGGTTFDKIELNKQVDEKLFRPE